MRIEFNGNIVDVTLGRTDFASQFGTDSLVYFSSEGGTDQVFVDEQASESYAKYAALHECICMGKCGHLAPAVDDPELRCSAIDKMIVDAMPEAERQDYVNKRIEMFETLINKNLNPGMTSTFEKSLKELKKLREP